MPIVNAKRLNNFMSSPQWTGDQEKGVEDILAGLERTLESSLYNAFITPRPCVEDAPILKSGLVATRQRVQSITMLDGTTIPEGDPLPSGWVIDARFRLRRIGSIPLLTPLSISSYSPFANPMDHVRSTGWVSLTYLGGWGDDPGLALAIMKKAADITRNMHDDTLTTSGTDGSQPARVPQEWTDDEIAALGTYRNLSAYR